MKLTTIILMISLMQVSAATFGQKVTLMENNVTLERVFWEIHKQTGYDVLIKNTSFKTSQRINVKFKETELDQVMDQVVKGTDLTYTIEDKTVVIKEKEKPSFLEKILDRFNNIDVSGKILDENGKPLPGASVKVKKTGKGVSTDKDGRFFLRGVEEGAVLVVSFIGYLPKEVSASANMGNVVLEQSLSKLDEVQVIAYGTTTQRLSTGNVTTIKADVIEKQPVNNPLLALQGRVPGLFIEQATGFAGTGVKVRIQGTNSMANGNDPLYVVDGVPFASQLLVGSNPILSATGEGVVSGNPLNFINPNDIQSIDVLKDADATAIYGSRAANGAILITTKKGKVGNIKVDANLQNGWGQVARKLDLMNATQYMEMRREAYKNDNITTIRPNDYDLNGVWDNNSNTDWQEELIGTSAEYTNVQASVSGGNDNIQFLVAANYHKEGNVFPGDFNDAKNSVHFNVNGTSSNQKFKAQFSGSFLTDNNLLPQVDFTKLAMTLSPVAPALYTSAGNINWEPNATGTTTFTANPLGNLFKKFKNETTNLIGNSILSYEILKGLEVKSSFGYTQIKGNVITTSAPTYPEAVVRGVRNTVFGTSDLNSWSVEPQISYKNLIGKGKLEILLGSTVQRQNGDASSINASGFSTDQVMEDIKSATTLTAGYSTNSIYKYNAIFGRINYNWSDKYIINLSARRDGSSRFGAKNQFHSFGAVGASWIFSEEGAFKDHLNFLSFGKLRASYGTTGSDQISDYQFLSLYDAIPNITAPYQGIMGYQPNRLTNPYLEWEETRKIQFGVDLGFFNDKILMNMNYSRNRSSNQLLYIQLPLMTGFYGVTSNFPATIQNTGWEFTLTTTNIQIPSFKWSTGFNLTIPKNKLIEFHDIENSPYKDSYVIGESINRRQLYHYVGINQTNGVYEFADKLGNPTSTPVFEDQVTIIDTDPKFYGGFENSFRYGAFQLDVLFQFVKQIGMNYFYGGQISPYAGLFQSGLGNMPSSLVNRWQSPENIGTSQRYTTGSFPLLNSQINILNSDASWSDASYIRLKNLSFSWELPEKWKRTAHFQGARLYLQGQNLLTITNYLGLDPETKNSLSLPPLRVLTFGVKVSL